MYTCAAVVPFASRSRVGSPSPLLSVRLSKSQYAVVGSPSGSVTLPTMETLSPTFQTEPTARVGDQVAEESCTTCTLGGESNAMQNSAAELQATLWPKPSS